MYGVLIHNYEKWLLLGTEDTIEGANRTIETIIKSQYGPYILNDANIAVYKENFPFINVVEDVTVTPYTARVTINTEDKIAATAKLVSENRRAAYQAEADELFFQEQRSEVAAGTWAAKVDEIKARFPK